MTDLTPPPLDPAARRMRDRVCIVTGAASGIGRASAIRFAAEGAKVVCADLKGQDETAAAIGAAAVAVQADAGSEDDVQDLVQTALTKVAARWPRLRDGRPEAYARTILYRDAVSWWRRHHREVVVATAPERTAPDVGGDEVPARVLFAQALARLTPKQRAVLVLRYFEDHTEAPMKATPARPVIISGTWNFILASMIRARIPIA